MTAGRHLAWVVFVCAGLLAQTSAHGQALDLQQAFGPDGGLVYDVTYGPGRDGKWTPFALTEVGVYAFDASSGQWAQMPVLPPEDRLAPPVPYRVDYAHLVADGGLYRPRDLTLLVTHNFVYVMAQDGQLHRASRAGGSWESFAPPHSTHLGNRNWSKASRWGASAGRVELDQVFAIRSDGDGTETSRLWRFDTGAWKDQDIGGRVVLVEHPRARTAARWRQSALAVGLPEGADRYQVDRFVRLRLTGDDTTRFREIAWRDQLRSRSADTRRGCAGATGMIETATGQDDTVLFALGRRTVCVSTDGGARFEARTPPGSVDRTGDLTAAVAFPWREAPAGVRLLVGTDVAFNIDGPRTRAQGGRLFLSDDAGKTWMDATPDIDGPGGFLGLAAGPTDDGMEVWLLTGRRGVYRGMGGLGFTRTSRGLNATPIHALARDPNQPFDLLAASPTGLYDWSGDSWDRASLMATRSLGTAPRADDNNGQLWAGTYWGVVRWRNRHGRWIDEKIPSPVKTAPLDIRAESGQLPNPIPPTGGMRPVSIVAPAGIDGERDRGYVLIDGEGVYMRGYEGAWTALPLPSPPPLRVVGLVAAPLPDGTLGAAVFTRRSSPEGFLGEAWLHRGSGDWEALEFPSDIAPQAALTAPDRVWLSTVARGLHVVYTKETPPKISQVADVPCDVLTDTPSGEVACVTAEESAEAGPPSLRDARSLAKIVFPATDPRPPMRLLAANPRGRNFPPPVAIAFTENRVGTWPWVSPGIAVYAHETAIEPLLPEVVDEPSDWTWLWLSLFAIISVLTLWTVWRLFRGRRDAKRRRVSGASTASASPPASPSDGSIPQSDPSDPPPDASDLPSDPSDPPSDASESPSDSTPDSTNG